MSALYLHIPFCKSKCHYCGFNSYAGCEAIWQDYFRSLNRELASLLLSHHNDFVPLKTIFFGGGTPTLVNADYLAALMKTIRSHIELSRNCEISVESNPETVDLPKLQQLREMGINRISFGVQSFKNDDLKMLGRVHSAEKAVEAVELAKKAGFGNINLDLMSGLEGQSERDWEYIIRKAVSCGSTHLSIYQLTPEAQTPLYEQVESGKIELPDDEHSLALDEITVAVCSEHSFKQYEISNFALSGFACEHNIIYWLNEPYLAAGAGAVSYVNGCRERRTKSPVEYCKAIEAGRSVVIEQETLSSEKSFRETVIVGLRLVKGVELKRLASRFGIDTLAYYGSTLERLSEAGLVEISDGFLFITKKGRPLTNQILTELV